MSKGGGGDYIKIDRYEGGFVLNRYWTVELSFHAGTTSHLPLSPLLSPLFSCSLSLLTPSFFSYSLPFVSYHSTLLLIQFYPSPPHLSSSPPPLFSPLLILSYNIDRSGELKLTRKGETKTAKFDKSFDQQVKGIVDGSGIFTIPSADGPGVDKEYDNPLVHVNYHGNLLSLVCSLFSCPLHLFLLLSSLMVRV